MIFLTSRPPKFGGFLIQHKKGNEKIMKNTLSVIFSIMIASYIPGIAHGACQQYPSCTSGSCTQAGINHNGCGPNSTLDHMYIGIPESAISGAQYDIPTCPQCANGYILKKHSANLSPSCTVEYYDCEKDCSAGCSNCNSTSWAALRTGYQSRTVATCSCTTCSKRTEYRCAAGYYGSTTNGTSGCTRCPAEDNAQGTSSAGSTAKTSCYIPSGTGFSNTSGKGSFAGNSYFCN